MQIQALQTSLHITDFEGDIKCVGIYDHALNFICPQQRLITFHREGRGLSLARDSDRTLWPIEELSPNRANQ